MIRRVALSIILASLWQVQSPAQPQRDALKVISQQSDMIVLEVRAQRPAFGRADEGLSTLRVPGLPLLSAEGMPELPFIVFTLQLPSTIIGASAELLDSDSVLVGPLVLGVKEEAIGQGDQDPPPHSRSLPLPQATGLYPEKVIEIADLGLFRDSRIVALRVYPYQLNRSSNVLYIHTRINVRLSLSIPTSTPHIGPPSPSAERMLRSTLALRRQAAAGMQVYKQTEPAVPMYGTERCRLLIDEDGLYRISYEQLRSAEVAVGTLDPTTLRLDNKGREVPMYVFGERDGRFDEGDYIEFWGEYNRRTFQHVSDDMYKDPFSDDNVYWLSWGGGSGTRYAQEEGLIIETDPFNYTAPFSYWSSVHIEADNHFNRLNQLSPDSTRDHWFFDSGISEGNKREYTFHLPWPDIQSNDYAEARVMMSGLSYAQTDPHDVSVYVNPLWITTSRWRGQSKRLLSTAAEERIPPNALVNGENTLTVINNVSPTRIDIVALNWFEISYPRLYHAENDCILFGVPRDGAPGLYEFRIDGFTSADIEVFKLGVSKVVGGTIEELDEDGVLSYRLRFQDEVVSPTVRYVAITSAGRKVPSAIEVVAPSSLKSPANRVDYLAIAPEEFMENQALRELLELREEQGLRTLLIEINDIYSEFNHGIRSPHAIRNFLKYTLEWQPPAPSFVLFVGDGSWDQKNIEGRGGDIVPVALRQTLKFGAVACDHWYALLSDDDEIPDIFIGRLPVRNDEELTTVAGKLVEYERGSPLDAWRNRLLFLGGNAQVFRDQNEDLIFNTTPERYHVDRLFTYRDPNLPYDPYFGGTEDLLDYFEEGVAYINYLGHGGGAIWADNSLFRLEDVARIYAQNRYPIISSMTCFTGAFDQPSGRCLGEEFLLSENKGSVAVFSTTGLGWLQNDYYLVGEFIEALVSAEQGATIGEIMTRAKIQYMSKYNNAQTFSMVNQYALLGDPALVPVLPQSNCVLTLSAPLSARGDSLEVHGEWGEGDGTAFLELVDDNRATLSSLAVPVTAGHFHAAFTIPAEFSTEEGSVTAYTCNEYSGDCAHGSVSFTLQNIFVDSVRTLPAVPSPADSVHLLARVVCKNAIERLTCILNIPIADTIAMRATGVGDEYITGRAIPPQQRGTLVQFFFVALEAGGDSAQSGPFSYRIPIGLYLVIDPGSVQLAGSDSLRLQATIYNYGDQACSAVPFIITLLDTATAQERLLGSASLAVGARGSGILSVPVSVGSGRVRVRLAVAPGFEYSGVPSSPSEVIVDLFVDRFMITPELGSTLWGTQNDTLPFLPGLNLHFPAGAVDKSCVLHVKAREVEVVHEQPDFEVMAIDGKKLSYTLTAAGRTDADFLSPYTITVSFTADSTVSAAGEIGMYRWASDSRKWAKIDGVGYGSSVRASSAASGSFTVIRSQDSTPPTIETTVEGQLYHAGGYTSSTPLITTVFQDANGIVLSPAHLWVEIDGHSLPWTELILPDSIENGNMLTVSIRPSLVPGEHVGRFGIADCSGNRSSPAEILLNVAEEFDLRVLGNYPNPFSRRTVFAYELTQWAEEFSFGIYTTAGHLVRKFAVDDILEDPDPLAPNYHEIEWDGTDDAGDDVANGVYFYKFRCSLGENVVERIGKVARIR